MFKHTMSHASQPATQPDNSIWLYCCFLIDLKCKVQSFDNIKKNEILENMTTNVLFHSAFLTLLSISLFFLAVFC